MADKEEEKKDDGEPATPSTAVEAEAGKEKKEDAKDESEAEVPAKFKKLVDEVEKMTVLELHELVKVLEKKFGVSAQAVAMAAPGAAGDSESDDESQDSFTVLLKSVGDQKIAVIKAIKALLGLGLKEAKDLTDEAPSVLKEGVKKAEAEEIKTKIEEAGGAVELQ